MKIVSNEDRTKDLGNVIGLFYEESNISGENELKYCVKTYFIISENGEIDVKLNSTYKISNKIEVMLLKRKLEKEGYLNLKEFSEANKQRLVGSEDIISTFKKK